MFLSTFNNTYGSRCKLLGKGSGFGKVILFGEHFVVYGIPGIVSAVDSTADAEVIKNDKIIKVHDDRKGSKGYAEKKKFQQLESIKRMLKKMNLSLENQGLNIWLGGSLPGFSGLGASAASSVAIARAIAQEFHLSFSNQEINDIAYEAEKAYAGNPSGIDNTAATFGGLLWFQKNLKGGPNKIESLSIEKPVEIIIGSTGIVANTKEMVKGVAKRKTRYPEKYDSIFNQAQILAQEARTAIKNFDLLEVGSLMDMNHSLLKEIKVSCKELDYLVDLAKKNGAFGAKLTGGGGGGCMTALTPGKELQEKVAKKIEKQGFQVLRTKIGVKGI
ncbi:mevalonate kinase [Candidatus Bathyarchaeota archaeon]|nr:mevalonate kinase [Candidatus Bathyarchaeota archaeon]